MFGRKKIAMVVAEFFGTFVLASAVLSMAGRTSFPFFAAAAAGLAALAMVLVIGPTSGSHINPAVTLGLWTLKKVPTTQAIVYIVAQMLGGGVAWRVNEYLLNQALPNLAKDNWDWRVFTAETIGTFILGFGVAAAVYGAYEGSQLAVAVGVSVFLGVIVASFAANGALNPAVALGVRSWNSTYILAPLLGSVLGMNLYALLFAPVPAKKKISKKQNR